MSKPSFDLLEEEAAPVPWIFYSALVVPAIGLILGLAASFGGRVRPFPARCRG